MRTTVVESGTVAGAASGKSGGFLARDWCDASALGPLARQSFDLHAALAPELGSDYGYRRLDTLGVVASSRRDFDCHRGDTPDWLDAGCAVYQRLGDPSTTAQVHPAEFTRAMMRAACDSGATLVEGVVENVVAEPAVRGVRVGGEVVACDAVVIAMGPWTAGAAQWLPLPPVFGSKGHSITLRPSAAVPAHALFVDCETDDGGRMSPEIFPRPDGEVYVCGLPDDSPLPARADQVQTYDGAGVALRRLAGLVSSRLGDATITGGNACYRPITRDGLPILGSVDGVEGAYVASGHSVWGILNAPASGEAMAELIADGRTEHVDLSPFDPRRRSLFS